MWYVDHLLNVTASQFLVLQYLSLSYDTEDIPRQYNNRLIWLTSLFSSYTLVDAYSQQLSVLVFYFVLN